MNLMSESARDNSTRNLQGSGGEHRETFYPTAQKTEKLCKRIYYIYVTLFLCIHIVLYEYRLYLLTSPDSTRDDTYIILYYYICVH